MNDSVFYRELAARMFPLFECIAVAEDRVFITYRLPSGTELIRQLIDSRFTITIQYSTDVNRARALNPRAASDGRGSDGIAFFNPSGRVVRPITIDPSTGKAVATPRPPYIGLGHELIHGLAYVTGTLVPREIEREHTFINERGETQTILTPVEELLTIGLIPGRAVTDNDLRFEHGIRPRVRH